MNVDPNAPTTSVVASDDLLRALQQAIGGNPIDQDAMTELRGLELQCMIVRNRRVQQRKECEERQAALELQGARIAS